MCLIAASILIWRVNNEIKHEHNFEGILSNTANDLSQNPIESIKFVDATQQCPTGWAQDQLGNWPGVKSGCICPGENPEIHRRAYCYFQFRSNCKKVNDYVERPLTKWDIGNKEKISCVKRVETW